MNVARGGAAGKRGRRSAGLSAALLLFAAAPVEARPDLNKPPRFAVELSKSTVVEGESVTVRLRCTANCTPDRFARLGAVIANVYKAIFDSAIADISISSVTGVSVTPSTNPRLSYRSFLQGTGANFGTASGTVTITTTDDSLRQFADRTVTVSASASSAAYWGLAFGGITVASATLTVQDNERDSVTLQFVGDTDGTIAEAATTGVRAVLGTSLPTETRIALWAMKTSDSRLGVTLSGTTLTVPANQTNSNTVTITAGSDETAAAASLVAVSATAPPNFHVPTDLILRIADDDSRPAPEDPSAAAITTGSVVGQPRESDRSTATFTVELATEPTAAVTLAVSSSDTGEGTVAPSSLTFRSRCSKSTRGTCIDSAENKEKSKRELHTKGARSFPWRMCRTSPGRNPIDTARFFALVGLLEDRTQRAGRRGRVTSGSVGGPVEPRRRLERPQRRSRSEGGGCRARIGSLRPQRWRKPGPYEGSVDEQTAG